MKYVALLRGINVGGNSIVKMAELKRMCEDLGLEEVRTYINSGNVIFESGLQKEDLEEMLEKGVLEKLKVFSQVLVLSKEELERIMADVPKEWEISKDMRKYISFIKKPAKPEDILPEVKITPGVDSIKLGNQTVYMSTLLSGITKTGFNKMIGTGIYKQMTMRNYNTVLKLFSLLKG
ncbi:MAG: DUF1697 domain-containing protein [Candidatus Levyibacteriota bacterium]